MSLLLVALLTIIWLLYMKSVHGVAIYGIGGNEQSAYVSGMDVARSKVLAHLFGGFCAFIGALVTTGLICSGDPNIGAEFGLKAVTAVVIGGVALCGGEGDVWGALAGGYFLSTILIAIISSNVSTFAQNFANYAIMIAGLVLTIVIKLVMEYTRTHNKKRQEGKKE